MTRLELAGQLLAAHLSRGQAQYRTNDGLLQNAYTLGGSYDAEQHQNHLRFLASAAVTLAAYVIDADQRDKTGG